MTIDKIQKCNTCDFFESEIKKCNYDIKNENSNIDFNSISVSVLPTNAKWSDMEGFTSYKFGPFHFNFINENNDTIAGISFYIYYNCHGKFNSSGHYLAGVTVAPQTIFANPGCYFSCNVTASDPLNFGTVIDPIAGINLNVQMQVKSYNNLILKRHHNLLTSYTSNDGLNIINQYLIVCVHGDSKAYVVTGYRY
ncbi:hypothetical protein ACFIJ5_13305 [Haloimpatiens sp. FM7330]|uniref:hypothetical protein n=1 Tax=Haloimpatiens sp. FM7330 TaxID=3298610 RepID=UPI0036424B17